MRITKEITVVSPTHAKVQFKGRTFRSYLAVAKALPPGARVIVKVIEIYGKGEYDRTLAGYGPVVGVKDGHYSEPRHLAHEY